MNSKFKGEYSGTKNVSERHEIDQNKLQEFLNDKLENFGDIKSIEEFVGGQSNPTYLLKTQKESYLNEQIKAIPKELGETSDPKDEIAEIEEKIKKTKFSND